MRPISICSIMVMVVPFHAIASYPAVQPLDWIQQVKTPFELRCTYQRGPIYPDYRHNDDSMRYAWYALLRERSFTVSYDGSENLVLTSADGEVIHYEMGFVDTTFEDHDVPGQSPMVFEPTNDPKGELGNIYVRYPPRAFVPTWKDEFMIVEHTKRIRDYFGNWAYRTATYTCATPEQIREYQPEAGLSCAREPFPPNTPGANGTTFECRNRPMEH